ncbi:MAG TPA: hypothetical protein VFF25_05740 [Clostridia bacterium]|nr:hypothetical protein [Clostridia bacterium]
MGRDEKQLLAEELELLEYANDMLTYSYNTCKSIGTREDYTFGELDKFEALTSRFARTSDMLIQKIFRLIDIIELERPGSVIDRINSAEKRGLISSSEAFKDIRYLRNDISHEYIPTAIEQMFEKVLELTPYIIDSVERVKKYSKAIIDKNK